MSHGKIQPPRTFAILCSNCGDPAVVHAPTQTTCNRCRYKAAGYEAR